MRVGMIDDHESVSVGVRSALAREPGCDVVGTARTVGEWEELDLDADVVVLDLSLADRSEPAENVRTLRARGSQVLVYTAGDDAHAIRQAARAGVVGVVLKTAPLRELVAAVLAAGSGQPVPTVSWAAALDADPGLDSAGLSPREAEVLALYAAGEKTVRVARELGISEHTVIEHLRSIRAKYERAGRSAPTKVDLYQRAVEDGFLPAPRRRQ